MPTTSNGSRKRRKPPSILIDRCITPNFARALQLCSVRTCTLEEAFPGRSQNVADVEWIAWLGDHPGWIAFTANPRIWHVPAERQAILDNDARVFSLASAQLTTDGKGIVYGRWWLSVMRRSQRTDPCFWRLDAQNVTKDLS